MDIIHLNDAFSTMRNGEHFSVSFVTLDENRKKGGDIISLKKCLLPSSENELIKSKGFQPIEKKTYCNKKPNHYEHATRNVLLENGQIKKFHIRLMLYFNNKKVFY